MLMELESLVRSDPFQILWAISLNDTLVAGVATVKTNGVALVPFTENRTPPL